MIVVVTTFSCVFQQLRSDDDAFTCVTFNHFVKKKVYYLQNCDRFVVCLVADSWVVINVPTPIHNTNANLFTQLASDYRSSHNKHHRV